MKTFTIKFLTLALASAALLMLTAATATENTLVSLQSLERERAALLQILTSDNYSIDKRYLKAENIVRRLADIERMVLRDDRIVGNDSIMVKKAFERYELSFLIHASAESKKLPIAHWLTELNFTRDSLLNSSVGNR